MNLTKSVKTLLNFRRLRNTQRCNNFPTVAPTDVAQHSYYVSLLAMTLADEYNAYISNVSLEGYDKINVECLLRKALLHDIPEFITGDVHWNVKHHDSEIEQEFNRVERKLVKGAFEGCNPVLKEYSEISLTCKIGLEGSLIAIADMLELAIYCWEECALGNKSLEGMLKRCIMLLKEYKLYKVLYTSSDTFSGIMELLQEKDYNLLNDLYLLG